MAYFLAALYLGFQQLILERLPGARQPAHHGADGDIQNLGHLDVGATLEIDQRYHLALAHGQPAPLLPLPGLPTATMVP
mgnify:CR=1 FL=1